MVLKIVIALVLIAIAIVVAATVVRFMEKDQKDERTEPIPTFDFNFDGKCHCEHCEHCEHNKKEEGDE